jgi:hypothetical protein
VVVVPPRQFCDFLVADWADAVLRFPETEQSSSPVQGTGHLDAEATFKIDFPDRVEGIGFPFHFDVALNGDTGCTEQEHI